jgi:hypothetical protein
VLLTEIRYGTDVISPRGHGQGEGPMILPARFEKHELLEREILDQKKFKDIRNDVAVSQSGR